MRGHERGTLYLQTYRSYWTHSKIFEVINQLIGCQDCMQKDEHAASLTKFLAQF